ncbi:MAG: DUF2808 domain-containing protein [Oscillatoriales cyanobacterium SM2_2_1]|nr:DUF2808 domain-containing protein [Oscillatoriales cyanobacterium SM2_2_1]
MTFPMKQFLRSAILASVAIASVGASSAQTNPGFILFGSNRDNALDYCLDSGQSSANDRYYLEVKPQKFKVSEIILSFPEHYTGIIDTDLVELRVMSDGECRGGKAIPITSAKLDQSSRRLVVIPKAEIPAETRLRVVLSNVRNPNNGGFFQIDARVLRADVPVPVYIGSYIMTIN